MVTSQQTELCGGFFFMVLSSKQYLFNWAGCCHHASEQSDLPLTGSMIVILVMMIIAPDRQSRFTLF